MPKIVPPSGFEVVLNAVRRLPHGAGIDLIQSMLGEAMAKRTLQRRLNELVRQGRLLAEGRKRGTIYRLPPEAGVAEPVSKATEGDRLEAIGEVYVPMSDEAALLRGLVRRSIIRRTPFGYRREFLLDYRPNESRYLPSETRARLRALGEFPSPERPAGTYARDVFGRLLIDLSWASSKLEGNTYTRLDTQRLIEHGEVATGKDARETQMILNHSCPRRRNKLQEWR